MNFELRPYQQEAVDKAVAYLKGNSNKNEIIILPTGSGKSIVIASIISRISLLKSDAWIVDLGGNVNFFGKIETMKIERNNKGLFVLTNNGKQLTNVNFTK